MKIAFDENVPIQMVRVFKALGQEKRFKNLDFVAALDYTPKPTDSDYIRKSDVPWLIRFAKAGGRVVVSGNVNMLVEPHELEALRSHFTVIMFERKWNQWTFHQKTSLLLFHWPLVLAKLRTAKIGDVWCIPNHFKVDGAELRDVTPDARQIKKTNPKARQRPSPQLNRKSAVGDGRRRRRATHHDARQGALELLGGGDRAAPAAAKGDEKDGGR